MNLLGLILKEELVCNMGVRVDYDCYSGSCSTFNSFRKTIAKSLGFNLEDMKGFFSNYKGFNNYVLGIVEWDTLPNDDFYILLKHSDCDGDISYEDCKKLLQRMLEYKQKYVSYVDNYYLEEMYQKWIDGLSEAISNKHGVEFH